MHAVHIARVALSSALVLAFAVVFALTAAPPAIAAGGQASNAPASATASDAMASIDLDAATAVDPATGERTRVLTGARLYHVVFFATWCPPCVDELPLLSDLHERWDEDGYALVLVAISNRQTRERVLEFVSEEQVPGRMVLDENNILRGVLGVDRIPAHLVIDDHGRVLLRTEGFDSRIADLVGEEIRRSR